nr:DUF4158 domain-containing protein [Streptomyces shenzhenensis]
MSWPRRTGRSQRCPRARSWSVFFLLDDDDRDLIALRRTDAHRLGMAVQICTVRYAGRFLGEDPLAVPWRPWSTWPGNSASRTPRA